MRRAALFGLLFCGMVGMAAADGATARNHVIQFMLHPDMLVVQETIFVEPGASPGTVEFKLPPTATLVEKTDNLEASGRVLSSLAPIEEGDIFRFRYTIGGLNGKFTLTRELGLPCSDLFAYGPEGAYRVEVSGAEVQRGVTTYQGRVIEGGRPYTVLTGSKLPEDHRIEVTFTHIVADNPAARMYVILAGLIIVGFALLIAGLTLEQRAEARRTIQTEAFVLGLIAELDKARKDGQIEQAFYEKKLRELKSLVE